MEIIGYSGNMIGCSEQIPPGKGGIRMSDTTLRVIVTARFPKEFGINKGHRISNKIPTPERRIKENRARPCEENRPRLLSAGYLACIRWMCHHCHNLLKEGRRALIFMEYLCTVSGSAVNEKDLCIISGLQEISEMHQCARPVIYRTFIQYFHLSNHLIR